MLVYHPFMDINHGILRAFVLRKCVITDSFDFDYWRIVDFFFVFPHKIDAINVPRVLSSRKRGFRKYYSKYNDIPFPREFLARSSGLHHAISTVLAAKGFLKPEPLNIKQLVWTNETWPKPLDELVEEQASENQEVLEFLRDLCSLVPFGGADGIKKRTELMEFRYDG